MRRPIDSNRIDCSNTRYPPALPAEIVHVTSSGLVVRLLKTVSRVFVDTRHSGRNSASTMSICAQLGDRRFELEQKSPLVLRGRSKTPLD